MSNKCVDTFMMSEQIDMVPFPHSKPYNQTQGKSSLGLTFFYLYSHFLSSPPSLIIVFWFVNQIVHIQLSFFLLNINT